MRWKKKKSWNLYVLYYIKIVHICRATYERNGIETIVDNDGILWLIEKKV